MSRAALFLLSALLLTLTVALSADELEGEVRVVLIFTQSASPAMLNHIRADIGTTEPTEEVWARASTATKKLKPGPYTVAATKAEVCSFGNCYPCPDQTLTFRLDPSQKMDVVFRWKARWNRVENKWDCR